MLIAVSPGSVAIAVTLRRLAVFVPPSQLAQMGFLSATTTLSRMMPFRNKTAQVVTGAPFTTTRSILAPEVVTAAASSACSMSTSRSREPFISRSPPWLGPLNSSRGWGWPAIPRIVMFALSSTVSVSG